MGTVLLNGWLLRRLLGSSVVRPSATGEKGMKSWGKSLDFFQAILFFHLCGWILRDFVRVFFPWEFAEMRCFVFFLYVCVWVCFFLCIVFFFLKSHPLFVGVVWFVSFCSFQNELLNDFRSRGYVFSSRIQVIQGSFRGKWVGNQLVAKLVLGKKNLGWCLVLWVCFPKFPWDSLRNCRLHSRPSFCLDPLLRNKL